MSLLLLLDHPRTVYSRGTNSTLPTTNADMSTYFSNADYTSVAADDSTYVSVSGQPYLIQVFDYIASSNTQPITVTWNGNTTINGAVRPIYLQIWNNSTSAWETLATNTTSSAGVDFTLTGSKTTNLSNYYYSGSTVTARVYQ